jgi:hypothetical protein
MNIVYHLHRFAFVTVGERILQNYAAMQSVKCLNRGNSNFKKLKTKKTMNEEQVGRKPKDSTLETK